LRIDPEAILNITLRIMHTANP